MARKGENIHKRKDGRWEARVIIHRDFSKKAIYKSIYGKTYLEAKHKKETILKNLSLSQSSNSGENILFESVIVLWLSHVKMKVKPKTYEKYYFLIKKHILPALGNMKLKEFDTQTINKFIYEKSKNGRLDNNGGLSANYIRTITFVITSVIQYINTEKIYPISLGKISLPQKPQSEVQVLSRYEQFKLEEYIQHHKTDRTLGILFSLYTGIRLGELCALTWDDIDFENKVISINKSVERLYEKNAKKTLLQIVKTKTPNSNRKIPLSTKLYDLLLDYIGKPEDHIISGFKHAFIDPRSIQYAFEKIICNCNIKKIKFHSLRHTFATRCIEAGMDVKTLSELLGHSSVNITLNTYIHSSMDHKREQLEGMVAFCGQKNGQYEY